MERKYYNYYLDFLIRRSGEKEEKRNRVRMGEGKEERRGGVEEGTRKGVGQGEQKGEGGGKGKKKICQCLISGSPRVHVFINKYIHTY